MRWIEPDAAAGERPAIGFDRRNWDEAQFLALGQMTPEHRMRTALLHPNGPPSQLPLGSPLGLDESVVHDPLLGRPINVATLLERRMFNDALLVWHDGAVRYERYRNGYAAHDRHLLHSVSKTLTAMMIGIAVDEGRLDLDAEIRTYVTALTAPVWAGVTVQHVLDMATGIVSDEHYEQRDSMYWRYADIVGYYGDAAADAGVLSFAVDHLVARDCAPGARFNYASYNSNLLPLCLEAAYGRSAIELYEQHLFQRIGPDTEAALNCDSTGTPIVEGQLNLTLRDLTRWGLLYLHGGRNLQGDAVVPARWVAESFAGAEHRRAAFACSESADAFPDGEYHNQLWKIGGSGGTAAMLGIHGQFVYLDPARQLLVAGVSSFPKQVDPLMLASLKTLWAAITEAVDS